MRRFRRAAIHVGAAVAYFATAVLAIAIYAAASWGATTCSSSDHPVVSLHVLRTWVLVLTGLLLIPCALAIALHTRAGRPYAHAYVWGAVAALTVALGTYAAATASIGHWCF